jgi:hypothetical protein
MYLYINPSPCTLKQYLQGSTVLFLIPFFILYLSTGEYGTYSQNKAISVIKYTSI